MKFKILLLSVVSFAVGFYMLSTPTIEEAAAWKTTVHLNCGSAPWGNCPAECNTYRSCLNTPPAAGCNTERVALCSCLQGLNPSYNCAKIPDTIASINAGDEQITTFEQDLAMLKIALE